MRFPQSFDGDKLLPQVRLEENMNYKENLALDSAVEGPLAPYGL